VSKELVLNDRQKAAAEAIGLDIHRLRSTRRVVREVGDLDDPTLRLIELINQSRAGPSTR
jgi:hypothetical protein